jgi:Mrp family chromosome partitioning ATPase
MGIARFRWQEQSNPSQRTLPVHVTQDGSLLGAFPPPVVNSLRRMLTQLAYQNALPDRFAMVSALREEGVTYTSLALATTLASDLATRVCAVELNWWSPSLLSLWSSLQRMAPAHEQRAESALPVASSAGFVDVLAGTATLEETLVPTTMPNLMLLPAGSLSVPQRPAVARSAELRTCIERLSERFDHLVLDIPAIMTTSDAIALASLGTACCVVVRQGVTSMNTVRLALDNIRHLPVLGIVLNRARLRTPRWILSFIPQD